MKDQEAFVLRKGDNLGSLNSRAQGLMLGDLELVGDLVSDMHLPSLLNFWSLNMTLFKVFLIRS